jgi:MFS family permease
MNLNHAMFSFAFAGSAFLTSLARKEGWDAGQVMPALALIAVALLLVMIERTPWEAETEQAHKPGADLPWTPIVMAAAILFAAFVCENATEAWSALHIERTLGAAHGTGGFGPMMLGLTMGFGRLGGQLVAEKVGEARLIMISALVGVVGALVIAWAPNEAVALTGVGLLGFGVAVMVPSANSILGHMVPKSLRGYAISRAWLFGFTGFFLGPTLMGFVSEQVGLRWAFVMIAGFMAAIVPLVLEMRRRGG